MDPPPLSAATLMAATAHKNYSDSVESSSPRSRNAETWNDEILPVVPGAKLRLMCSYGGHIIPRPHDKSLCYVGGDTRIVVVDRHSSLKDLCSKLSRTILNGRPFTLKYQLPSEDLDSLITVTTDEDLDNMVEEYDRIAAKGSASSRLRVFLFFTKPEATVSMGSLLDDVKSETWFVDALNNSGMLTRVVSDSAAGDSFVNLDGDGIGVGVSVSASGSSNNLEALPDAHNKAKNLPEVVPVQSNPGSPMMENSSSSPSFSPSMANLPPIRVRVDDNGSRLQQENKVGVMVEEQFAHMTIASGVKSDDGLVNVVSSAMAVPAIPAAVTMTTVGVVTTSDNVMNRVVPEDERSDHGFRKPPLPLQLVQPKTSGGLSLPSPDSVTSDSSIASANSFSKTVYYQDQVQAALLDNNKAVFLPNAKSEISDQVIQVTGQVQDSGYTLPPQLDQTKQLHQQKPLLHASTHYIHHPAATGPIPVSSYYPVYAPPPTQQLHPPIGQQQYPVYVMHVGPTQPYNMALQPNIGDPNVVRPLMSQSAVSVTSATYKDGTPPIYPTKSITPTIPEVSPSVYKAPPVASNPTYAPIPPNQFQPQYVGLPQFHHPPQSIAVAPSSTDNYGYEYGGHVQEQAYYTQHQQTTAAPLLPQYQSMTPVAAAAAAAALSDASNQYPVDNIQQPNRASQPV